ncbi:hypothetical protein O181_060332 [Austropuccinia psidii MF-1]|uniref:Chromo domain-containing protein n=1 Tax=Austropuccinia psidii MF-1 TaxID=1389203 RepID=A0A9Q3HYB8_9BASI|nr:hypothetical protein [Austropuccinia psidii MF-1]
MPNRNQEPPPQIIIEDKEEWEVLQILDSKFKRRNSWYLVEWTGFSQEPERCTWEPTEKLKHCPELVKDFHILKSQDIIHQELHHLWCLLGRGITECKSHSLYGPLEVFSPFVVRITLAIL